MAGTVYVYATPADVSRFLQLRTDFDANSHPTAERVTQWLLWAEGRWEKRTGTSWRRLTFTDWEDDAQATVARHRELLGYWQHRPIYLPFRPLLPFDASRGHRIEVYEGSDAAPSAADPIPRWTDYLSTKTQGRDADWWCDYDQGILFVKKFLVRRNAMFRITGEYGFPISALNGAHNSSVTTLTMVSTYRYPSRGIVRIGDEYIHYTGKTSTTLTGCTRGALDTEAVSHSDADEVYYAPDDVRELIVKYAAATYLENEVFSAAVADGGSTISPDIRFKIEKWKQEFEEATPQVGRLVLF